MKDHRRPLTTGGTAHGIRIKTRVTRESHTRSSLMVSATARPITTSSATEATTKTTVCRRDGPGSPPGLSRLPASSAPLGRGQRGDHVVTGLIGAALALETRSQLHVDGIAPPRVPRLGHRRHHVGEVGRLLEDVEDGGDIRPLRLRLAQEIALHHRLVAARQHGVLGQALRLCVLAVLGAPAQVLLELPRPFLVLGGAREDVEHGVADGLAVAGQSEHASLPGDGRLRLIVDQADVVMVQRAEKDMLAGIESLAGGNEAQVERIGVGQLFLEGALPPLERLARHRSRSELRRELLVEDDAPAIPREIEPGPGQLLESRAGDPENGILRHAVLLGLARLLDELGIALERLALEAGLPQKLVVVDEDPGRGEVRQAPGLAVALRGRARERREVLDVLVDAGQPVDRHGDALLDIARQILDGREGDVHLVARAEHGGELRHLRLDVRLDDLVELDAPVVLELLGDLLVDLAVLPDHEGELLWIAGRALGPRGALGAEYAGRQRRARGRGGHALDESASVEWGERRWRWGHGYSSAMRVFESSPSYFASEPTLARS